MQHIVLVRLSALGDVTLMVPVVRAIQRAHPSWKITWVIGRSPYQLLSGLSGVEFLVIDKPRSFKDYWRLWRRLRKMHFDVLLAAQASLRANLIYPLIHASTKLGFDKKRARDGHHFVVKQRIPSSQEHLLDGFMQFAKKLGVDDTALSWDLPIEASHWVWAKQRLNKPGRWLAINAVSSKSERNWFVERYVAVMDEAVKRWGVHIVLTGGPDAVEMDFAKALCEKASVACLNLVGQHDMKSLAALLGSVDALLAPDTGPVHIATAMGTPVVGLYAVASAELSGPYFSQHLVVDRHAEAVRSILKKDPEQASWGERVHDSAAMKLITVEDVLKKLDMIFGGSICE